MSLRTSLVVVMALCLSPVVTLASSEPSAPPAALALHSANPLPVRHCLDLSAGQPSSFVSLPWVSAPALESIGRQQAAKITSDCLKTRISYYPTSDVFGTPCGHTDIYCSGEVVHAGCTSQYSRTFTSSCICP